MNGIKLETLECVFTYETKPPTRHEADTSIAVATDGTRTWRRVRDREMEREREGGRESERKRQQTKQH